MSSLFSFKHGEEAVMHGEFMGFVQDDDSLLHLRSWAERQGYPAATVQQGGSEIFAQMLESSTPPKMAIIDIDGQADPVATTARLISLCGGECRLIIVGSANDVTLYRRMLAAGAIDYMVKPLTPDVLNQALATALRGGNGAAKSDTKEASIVLVIGARGGCGASTLAMNAGWLLAHENAQSVALFDLDLQFGTSSLSLDLEPGRGLRDIVSSPNRVDSLMIASSIVPESENFSILGAEEPIDELVPVDSGAITALLKEMKVNFDTILIDLPRSLLPIHKRLAVNAHEIVLVSDMTLAGIRDTLRIKNALLSLGCSARFTLVAARANAAGEGHVSRAVFEKGVQSTIDILLPEDGAAMATASNSGKALGACAPRSVLTKALRELARRLGKVEEAESKSGSLWGKLTSGKGKKHDNDCRFRR